MNKIPKIVKLLLFALGIVMACLYYLPLADSLIVGIIALVVLSMEDDDSAGTNGSDKPSDKRNVSRETKKEVWIKIGAKEPNVPSGLYKIDQLEDNGKRTLRIHPL